MAAVAAVHPHFQSLNCEVLAISTDSIYAHKVFRGTSPSLQAVHYPLLSDRTQSISKSYRVLDHHSGAAFRASVFVDPDQVIVSKLIYPREIGRNLYEHIRMLQAIQYGRLTGKGVPANWMPGQQGIAPNTDQIGKI